MRKSIFTICAIILIAAGCSKQNLSETGSVPSPAPQYNYTHQLKVGGQSLMVEISTTPMQMEQGLSDRVSMDDDYGMLFDFGLVPSPTPFWMKDMKFNLDFIWIAGGKVVGLTPNALAPKSPSDQLPLYLPPEPVSQVLEVNAGWAENNKIKTGDEVRLVK
jgi:uncharacterized membrane protein (UPF0127 family)